MCGVFTPSKRYDFFFYVLHFSTFWSEEVKLDKRIYMKRETKYKFFLPPRFLCRVVCTKTKRFTLCVSDVSSGCSSDITKIRMS